MTTKESSAPVEKTEGESEKTNDTESYSKSGATSSSAGSAKGGKPAQVGPHLFYIPNSSASNVTRFELRLGELPKVPELPEFADKAAYRKWCSDPKTDHVFLSACEGLSATRICSLNQPYRIHGLIGEFDTQPQGEWLADIVRNSAEGLSPLWACRSFSGNLRLIWAFKEPVVWFSKELEQAFYKVAWSAIKPNNLVLGFVPSESSDPGRYFEVGSEWQVIPGGSEVPTHMTQAWLAKALDKINWSREGVALPIAAIREEGERRFPGRWPGGWEKFEVGARGCRFWDANADAMSVVVRETGCTAFTGDKPFMFWADIFGHSFVDRLSEATVGKAIQDLWWEPNKNRYWRKLASGAKQPIVNKTDLELHLTKHGLTKTVARSQTHSQVEDAIWAVQNTRTVVAVFPAMFHPDDTIMVNGQLLLNTSDVKLIQPVQEQVEWGEGFPVIAELLELMFRNEQLSYFLGWLAHFYRSCRRGAPERGLGLFIAGPPNNAKSYLNRAVLGQLFGSHQDAGPFLAGGDKFNENLIASPLWTIDDAVAATDSASRNRYSQLIKMAIANDQILCRGMFKAGVTVPWRGRIVVTMNEDSESARMIPNLELSMRDKVMLLKAYPTSDLSYAKRNDGRLPDNSDTAAELPYFGAFLRDMKIEAPVWAGSRFGIKPYHHQDLLDVAEDASGTSGAKGVLEYWRERYFKEKDREKQEYWEGSPTELLVELLNDGLLEGVVRGQFKSAEQLGVYIGKLINRGEAWVMRYRRGKNRDTVLRVGKPGRIFLPSDKPTSSAECAFK